MRVARPVVVALLLVVLMLLSGPVSGQKIPGKRPGDVPLPPAEKAVLDASALQASGEIAKARDRMKAAVRIAPRNKDYKAYLTELDGLVEQELLDRHALKAPGDVETDLERLAQYLAKAGQTDRDHARTIFRWVTDRVAYDVEGLRTGKYGDLSAEGVLKSRKSVCEGYSNLYAKLGKLAGLEVVKVTGHAKGAGFAIGETFKNRTGGHAWNAVKLDGNWQLLDSTWGAGSVNGPRFEKRFNDFYFLTPPGELAFSHFPADTKWTLLDSPTFGEEQYSQWPKVTYHFFQLGFKPVEVQKRLESAPAEPWPDAFSHEGTKVTILQAPLERKLKAGKRYTVRFKARGFVDLALVSGNKFVHLPRKGDVYESTFTPPAGDLMLMGKLLHKDGKYWSILVYDVK